MNFEKILMPIFICTAIGLMAGCTVKTMVRPLALSSDVDVICIHENPQVIIGDFLPVLQEGIIRNKLRSRAYREIPSSCSYVIEYVATQRWDFKTFMSDADIRLYHATDLVGSVSYQLPSGIFGGGGINLSKFDSTKEKLDPLLDELFKNYSSARPIPSTANSKDIPEIEKA